MLSLVYGDQLRTNRFAAADRLPDQRDLSLRSQEARQNGKLLRAGGGNGAEPGSLAVMHQIHGDIQPVMVDHDDGELLGRHARRLVMRPAGSQEREQEKSLHPSTSPHTSAAVRS